MIAAENLLDLANFSRIKGDGYIHVRLWDYAPLPCEDN
jgi:hypothetical protein